MDGSSNKQVDGYKRRKTDKDNIANETNQHVIKDQSHNAGE